MATTHQNWHGAQSALPQDLLLHDRSEINLSKIINAETPEVPDTANELVTLLTLVWPAIVSW
jgi:hypothetical protein